MHRGRFRRPSGADRVFGVVFPGLTPGANLFLASGAVRLANLPCACQTARMNTSPLGFQCVKVIALSVLDLERANEFYGKTLGLAPAFEGDVQVGWALGDLAFMLKPDWQAPAAEPNPRVTILVENAPATEAALRERGVRISDPVETYEEKFSIGSFLDSEGNKLWFCSPLSDS